MHMASSSSNLVDNLVESVDEVKCNYRHDNKKYEQCKCCLEYTNVKDNLLTFKC